VAPTSSNGGATASTASSLVGGGGGVGHDELPGRWAATYMERAAATTESSLGAATGDGDDNRYVRAGRLDLLAFFSFFPRNFSLLLPKFCSNK
jgi:hypothetical protein